MIGLILAVLAWFLSFAFITIFYLPKAKKIKGYDGVKYAREKLHIVSRNIVKAISVKLEVDYENKEEFLKLDQKEGIVFISNHSSNFDIPILIVSIPMDVAFVAKKEMETWPFFGTWMQYSKCAFLDRKNPREGMKGIKKAVEIVKQGHPMFIFPQGTRTQGFGENQFKKGSFKLVTEVNGYVVPVVLKGSDNIQAPGKKSVKIGQKVKVYIGNPIKVSEMSEEDLKRINEVLEEKIRTIYEKI